MRGIFIVLDRCLASLPKTVGLVPRPVADFLLFLVSFLNELPRLDVSLSTCANAVEMLFEGERVSTVI